MIRDLVAALSPAERDALFEELRRQRGSEEDSAPAFAVPHDIPLTALQHAMWLDELQHASEPAYHVHAAFSVEGTLRTDVLRNALQHLARRHEALRVRIVVESGVPLQRIGDDAAIPFTVHPADADPLASARTAIARRFELDREAPLRADFIPAVADERPALLVLTAHHIVCDGTSFNMLMRDLASFYSGAFTEESQVQVPVGSMYRKVMMDVLHGEEVTRDEDAEFWSERLRGLDDPVRFPFDRTRSPDGGRGLTHTHPLTSAFMRKLEAVASAQHVTPFALSVASVLLLLSRAAYASDVAVAVVGSTRRALGANDVVANLVSTLTVRARIDEAENITGFARSVHHELAAVLEHSRVPIARLAQLLGVRRHGQRAPWFTVMVAEVEMPRLDLVGLDVRPVRIDAGGAKFDLSVDIVRDPQTPVISLEYDPALYTAATISSLAQRLAGVLAFATERPDAPLNEVPLFLPSEDDGILRGPLAPDEGPATVVEWIGRTADGAGTTIAVTDSEEACSYAELWRRSGPVAAGLRRRGVGAGSVIGIAGGRSVRACVAMIAVWRAGAAFLPLDARWPAAHMNRLLASASAGALIDVSDAVGSLDVPVWSWSDLAETTSADCDDAPSRPDDPAYVIFTSGSTGEPKGVVISHGALCAITRAWHEVYGLGPSRTPHLQLAGLAFDVWIGDVARALTSGAELLIPADEIRLDATRLYKLMATRRTAFAEFTPTLIRPLVAFLRHGSADLSFMQVLVVGSESWPAVEARAVRELCGASVHVFNSYGSTETTIDAACLPNPPHEGAADDESSAIGRPLPGVELAILDLHGHLVPSGFVGELAVAGAGLAMRIIGSEDRFVSIGPSATRFFRTGDRAVIRNGLVHVLGRNDRQLKVHGIRIDPQEIEVALRRVPGIQDAAVVFDPVAPGGGAISALYETSPGASVAPDALRRELSALVPAHLIPRLLVPLPRLLRTTSNKPDLTAMAALIPEPGSAEFDGAPPLDDVEWLVAAETADLLGVSGIPLDSDIFVMGGYSLLAAQLANRLAERFHVSIPIASILQAASVSDLARSVESALRGEAVNHDGAVDRETISPDDLRFVPPRPLARRSPPPRRRIALVTGATGFLGAHVAAELLRRGDMDVLCVVRARDRREGHERLLETFRRYGLDPEAAGDRLLPLLGDIRRPLLGLSESIAEEITQRLTLVMHAAARSGFHAGYASLRPTNLDGTREVLALAARNRDAVFVHVSTVSVFNAGLLSGTPFLENDDPRSRSMPLGGYPRSKWAAEQLALHAARQGLPVRVVRPGGIGGAAAMAVSEPRQVLWSLMRDCLRLGAAPDLPGFLNLVPVDHVARAILRIAEEPAPASPAYTIVNREAVGWRMVVDELRKIQPSLDLLDYEEWRRRAAAAGVDTVHLIPDDLPPSELLDPVQLLFDDAAARTILGEAYQSCPTTGELLPRYVAALHVAGILPDDPPRKRRAASGPSGDEMDHLSTTDVRRFLDHGVVSSLELADHCLKRIRARGAETNAVVHLDAVGAREQARHGDRRLDAGERGPLLGIPVTVKESIEVAGLPRPLDSGWAAEGVATEDGPLAAALRRAGAVILGKTNAATNLLDWQTYNEHHGRTVNPHDAARTAGGSSGGCAAAVASGLVPISYGTDLIGSIRIPAAFCGVFGHRPSDELEGAAGAELDGGKLTTVHGPIAATAEDLVAGLSVLMDLQSLDFLPAPLELRGQRVVVLPAPEWLPVTASVEGALDAASRALVHVGACVELVRPGEWLDLQSLGELCFSLLGTTLAGFGSRETERAVSSSDRFVSAWRRGLAASARDIAGWAEERAALRRHLTQELADAVLLTPIVLGPAYPHLFGTSIIPDPTQPRLDIDGRLVAYAAQAVLPAIASVPGLPATAFPAGVSREGLPIGLQVIGPPRGDLRTIHVAGTLATALARARAARHDQADTAP